MDKILNEIESLLEACAIEYDFYFEDSLSARSFRSGAQRRYPFGSCFKLGELGSFFEHPDAQAIMERSLTISDNDKITDVVAVLDCLNLPIELKVKNLISLMMKYCDEIATDAILDLLGIENVNAYIQRVTINSQFNNNLRSVITDLNQSAAEISKGAIITREHYLNAMNATTCKMDYTDAKDLVLLLKTVAQSSISREFLFREQANPRSASYVHRDIKIFGKTGTLGYWASVNDCGLIVKGQNIVGSFGLVTLGWTQPRHIVEHTFGMVGKLLSSIYSEADESPAFK